MKKGVLFSAILASTVFLGLLYSGTYTRDFFRTAAAKEPPVLQAKTDTGDKDAQPEEDTLAREHLVKKGECLWWIAEYEDVFNDPFMWPLIYTVNKDQIDSPGRIYPEQVLRIPRKGYTLGEIREVRRRAGAPPPYGPPQGSLPPVE